MLELCRAIAERVQAAIAPLVGKGREKEIDVAAEKAAFDGLRESGLSMLLVSEESGITLIGEEPEYICQLDPLDGTFNAANAIPAYAFSIAFSRYKKGATLEDIEHAFVKNLVTGESYEASKGKGARKNDQPLEPSEQRVLEEGTYCVYLYGSQLRELSPALERFNKIRILGCASLELCYVASGGYEGFIDLRGCLRNVDIAAGKLIVEEAGGRVTGKHGENLRIGIEDINTTSLVAGANSYLYGELASLLGIK
jgi:myo-inositol-1(or 4)-monophosphatase